MGFLETFFTETLSGRIREHYKNEETLIFSYPFQGKATWFKNYWFCDEPGRLSSCKGLTKDYILFIAESLNTSISWIVPSDVTINNGKWWANGTWDGSAGDVMTFI